MSEELRSALQRAVGKEPTVGDAFARFEHKRAVSTRLRAVTVVLIGAAAVVALILSLPGAGGSGPPIGGGPGGTSSPQTRFLHRATDTAAGFEIIFPAEWSRPRGTRGRDMLAFPLGLNEDGASAIWRRAAGVGPSVESPTRLYVSVTEYDHSCRPRSPDTAARCEDPSARARDIEAQKAAGGVDVTKRRTTLNGAPADLYTLDYKTSEPRDGSIHPVSWCARCSIVEYIVTWPGDWYLDVRVTAPNRETLESQRSDWEAILKSISAPGR